MCFRLHTVSYRARVSERERPLLSPMRSHPEKPSFFSVFLIFALSDICVGCIHKDIQISCATMQMFFFCSSVFHALYSSSGFCGRTIPSLKGCCISHWVSGLYIHWDGIVDLPQAVTSHYRPSQAAPLYSIFTNWP